MPISSNKIQGSRKKEIRAEQRNAGQGKAGQGKASQSRERTGQGGQGGNEIFGSDFRQTRCSLQNAVCGQSMDLSEPWGQLDDGT